MLIIIFVQKIACSTSITVEITLDVTIAYFSISGASHVVGTQTVAKITNKTFWSIIVNFAVFNGLKNGNTNSFGLVEPWVALKAYTVCLIVLAIFNLSCDLNAFFGWGVEEISFIAKVTISLITGDHALCVHLSNAGLIFQNKALVEVAKHADIILSAFLATLSANLSWWSNQ